MMRIPGCSVALLLVFASFTGAADPNKCSVKLATSEAPKELADPIRALLSGQSVQVSEGDKVLWEIWLPKQLDVKATGDEVQKGINYRKLEESTVLGAIKVNQAWNSFRKQTIKPGVYTLRLGFQPMDGDHMGSAPFNEFLLLSPANEDKKTAILSHKDVTELSGKSIPGGSHPAVLLLFPNQKPGDKPELANKGSGNWVLNWKTDVTGGGQKGVLGVGLTLFGATTAE